MTNVFVYARVRTPVCVESNWIWAEKEKKKPGAYEGPRHSFD